MMATLTAEQWTMVASLHLIIYLKQPAPSGVSLGIQVQLLAVLGASTFELAVHSIYTMM
ncbi:MAG: hypothetical protein ACFFAL_11125 [Promethearchaeota archaeon]